MADSKAFLGKEPIGRLLLKLALPTVARRQVLGGDSHRDESAAVFSRIVGAADGAVLSAGHGVFRKPDEPAAFLPEKETITGEEFMRILKEKKPAARKS